LFDKNSIVLVVLIVCLIQINENRVFRMNVTGDQVEVLGVNKLGDEYTVNLQPSKGICRVTLNFEHAPKGLTFQLSPWKERLEV